jgi:hypothetical protein
VIVEALAVMDHPGIAKVFDAGATEAGRPYFVMEAVQGLPGVRRHLILRESRRQDDPRLSSAKLRIRATMARRPLALAGERCSLSPVSLRK